MKKTEKVFVDRPALLEDILSSIPPKRKPPPPRKVAPPIIDDSPSTLLKARKIVENAQTEVAMKRNLEKSITRSLEKQEELFPVLLSNVERATQFLDIIDKDLTLFDETKRNKTRRQFEDWNNNVHGVIQQNIIKTVNKMDSKELNKKKNEDYGKFLNITNKKPAIFRDIIIESEYDPLEPNRRAIKTRTEKLKDPTNIDALKAESESSMLGAKVMKTKLGKDTLPVELWASGQIEATPYGMFAKMMGDDSGSDRSKTNATMKSKVVFNDFDYATGRDAVEAEMPRGKRIYPRTIYADPGRVFGNIPPEVERELATIKPPANTSYLSNTMAMS